MAPAESLPDRVRRIAADLRDLEQFHSISVAQSRHDRLTAYYTDELASLHELDFDALDQQDRVDFIVASHYLNRQRQQLKLKTDALSKYQVLIPFAEGVISLYDDRQAVAPLDAQKTAQKLNSLLSSIQQVHRDVQQDKIHVDKTPSYQASTVIKELQGHLREWFSFYASYDPAFDWWVTQPFQDVKAALKAYALLVQTKLVGADKAGGIIGEPIGREWLLSELKAEMIPYSPEQLLDIADKEYAWCEKQMKSLAAELGYNNDWKDALEHVKNQYVPPGQQIVLVRDLVHEGAAYVRQHDLVTVPPLAEQTWRLFTMPPAQQKLAPFFLGGPSILVASPTSDMSQDLKAMVLRGNNRHFSRAVAFHEMIPGHRLQFFMATRHQPHRSELFSTPFFVEGWALYWEMLLWHRGDFFVTPEDKIGTMFWRMHRCIRIVFSLKFHLGQLSPQECVDLLVDKVGHERSTAEGEVRRSLEGSYGPLYQAGYMLGALQLWKLRGLVLDEIQPGKFSGPDGEKRFHDEVLRVGVLPIEMAKALLLDEELTPDFETKWKFYE